MAAGVWPFLKWHSGVDPECQPEAGQPLVERFEQTISIIAFCISLSISLITAMIASTVILNLIQDLFWHKTIWRLIDLVERFVLTDEPSSVISLAR